MNSFHPQNSRVDELLPVPGLNRKHLQEGDGLICRHIGPASVPSGNSRPGGCVLHASARVDQKLTVAAEMTDEL